MLENPPVVWRLTLFFLNVQNISFLTPYIYDLRKSTHRDHCCSHTLKLNTANHTSSFCMCNKVAASVQLLAITVFSDFLWLEAELLGCYIFSISELNSPIPASFSEMLLFHWTQCFIKYSKDQWSKINHMYRNNFFITESDHVYVARKRTQIFYY